MPVGFGCQFFWVHASARVPLPHLTSTLAGDNRTIGATKKEQNKCKTQSLVKHFSKSSFSVRCDHKLKKSLDLQVDGVLIKEMFHSPTGHH